MAKGRANPGAGRPSDLTPATQKKVVNAVKSGAVREHAAGAAGIGKATLYRWLQKGKNQKSGKYRDFRDAVIAAESHFAVRNIQTIQKAADGYIEKSVKETYAADGRTVTKRETTSKKVFHPDMAAYLLRVRFPGDYGESSRDVKELKAEVAQLQKLIAQLVPASGTEPAGQSAGSAASPPLSPTSPVSFAEPARAVDPPVDPEGATPAGPGDGGGGGTSGEGGGPAGGVPGGPGPADA